MLTITDFIRVLHKSYYHFPQELDRLGQHSICQWRELLSDELKPLVSIDADDSLYNAIMRLHDNNFRRILVLDEVERRAVYMLTHRRIVQFIAVLMEDLSLPDFMRKSIYNLGVGTYTDIATVTLKTRLIDALTMFIERRVSALAVVDDDGRLVNAYSKFDTINLVGGELYKNLDCTVNEALQAEHLNNFEGVLMCRRHDPLASIIKYMVHSDVHRLWITDDSGHLEGVVSLSDIIRCLIIQQVATHVSQTSSDDQADILTSDSETDSGLR
jgi:5'-AMP-activated protein kinase regulatory gamma subunit